LGGKTSTATWEDAHSEVNYPRWLRMGAGSGAPGRRAAAATAIHRLVVVVVVVVVALLESAPLAVEN
jgi:hypothetical protein